MSTDIRRLWFRRLSLSVARDIPPWREHDLGQHCLPSVPATIARVSLFTVRLPPPDHGTDPALQECMSRRVLPGSGHTANDASALIDQNPVRVPQLEGQTVSNPAVPDSVMDLVLIALPTCKRQVRILQVREMIDIW